MTTINDRIGSQNVIRVLSNASAPPSRLANLGDVDSTRETETGLVLVWEKTAQKFVLTDTISAATIIQTGITSFSNTTNSTSPTTGALKIAGGVGIEKNLNIAANLQVTGVSTFVGVVTTTNDLYVGGDLYVKDDIVYDEVNGRQINISGVGTFGSIYIGGTEVISSSLALENVSSLDSTTASTVQGVIFSGGTPNTFEFLNVTGITTTNKLNVTGVTTFNNADVVFQGAAAGQNITFDASENDLEFTDDARLKFGNSDDLEIWHSGNTHIKNSTGDLKIRSDSLILKRENDTEAYLKATVNEDVKLYYNGTEKFATTSDGVNVLGTLTAQLIDGGSY